MANTTEVNSAKRKAASRCDWTMLTFLPDGDVVGVQNAEDVQQAGNQQKLGSKIGNGRSAFYHVIADEFGNDEKKAGAQVAQKAEGFDDVRGVQVEQAAVHGDSKNEHEGNRQEQHRSAAPAALQ